MHIRLFVTFTKEEAETSREARSLVNKELLSNKLFMTKMCDWFVIGGRWSGKLSKASSKKPSIPLDARDTYEQLGYDDDAMVVTKRLYMAYLKDYEGKAEYSDNFFSSQGSYLVFADLNSDKVTPQFIGTKWIVVVDYHT